MSDKAIVLAVDFDGVIHDHKHPEPGKRMGKPFPEAQDAMQKLVDRGFHVYIFTTKATTEGGQQAVLDWLEHYDIPFYNITAMKVNAAIYIDDRSIRHTTWANTLGLVEEILGVSLDD